MARYRRSNSFSTSVTVGLLTGVVAVTGGVEAVASVIAPTSAVAATDHRDRVLKLAAEQIGVSESPAGSNRTKFGADYGMDGVAWCAEFVWWTFDRGASGAALQFKTASVDQLREAFTRAGRFVQDPQPGDVVIYNFGGDKDHTGIVESVQDKTITAIEGNTSKGAKGSQDNGGTVARKVRARNSQILGYGRPDWLAAKFGPLSSPYNDFFERAGNAHGVSPVLLAAMAKQESGFNPKAGSSAGAQGLMQFMPATAQGYGIDPWDPAQAVDGAARKMRDLLKEFDGNVDYALAAYNAGSSRVRQFGGVPPCSFANCQTFNYVKNIRSMEGAAA